MRTIAFTVGLLLYAAQTCLSRSPGGVHGREHSHPNVDVHSIERNGVASFPVLGRRNGTIVTNTTTSTELLEAERLVKAAQEEARLRNTFLVGNVRRNIYKLKDYSGNAFKEDAIDPVTGTGINETITDAAALVTEFLAVNGTEAPTLEQRQASTFWMEGMVQNGRSPYVGNSTYKVWRNVRDYGAKGNGIVDDTAAINKAIADGNRCGQACGSTTILQAVVYFPPGTYLVSKSITQYYFTQFIGHPTNRPTIKASSSFVGLGVVSSNSYIEGGDGSSWYINQSNFYRQIRNIIIDLTEAPKQAFIAGIHWQIAQATSLQNVKITMSTVAGNNQQGIFMENGSGGFLADIEFIGGSIGAYVGNQQFSVRDLKFSNHQTKAIEIHWDWGWTWKGVSITNCPIGILMSTPGTTTEVGSAIFLDSTFTNCAVGVQMQVRSADAAVTLSLFNLNLANVPIVVKYAAGATLLRGTTKTATVAAWGVGKRYDTSNGEAAGVWQDGAYYPKAPVISSSLLKIAGNQLSGFFERSKPQYETLSAANFVNVKLAPYNALGDGSKDDTAALNAALLAVANTNKVLWIPAGVYVVSSTVFIPSGVKVVGQSWAQIMASGFRFENVNSPYPVIKVGNVGDVGSVEIQDLIFTVRGKTAGAIILQWNIHESSPGSAAMWDTHIRIGGARGTGLQVTQCPKNTGAVNRNCMAASLLVHITAKASAYFENTWFWVADHDLDIPAQTQIDIYVGRGVLIESEGPVWLYGTASEHCVLYQYQTVDAANIFMGMIQTEEPYFQPVPQAPAPFTVPSSQFKSDPLFQDCSPTSKTCAVAWGVRFVNSRSIFLYGAGLYSWFSDYSQTCLLTENCQDRILEIRESSDIWIYSLITKASVEMISPNGGLSVLAAANKYSFCSVVMAWLGSASGGEDSPDGGVKYNSPLSATVIPFAVTTVAAQATFTIGGPVTSNINTQPNTGNQNLPKGPGEDQCVRCDLIRLITSTCCGTGGGVSNPILINPETPLPRSLILPSGFVPNQSVEGADGRIYLAGRPLPNEVIVPGGTEFAFPFSIPPGLTMSNTYTPGSEEQDDDHTMYIITTFWEGPLTVSCSFPCTILFPPFKTRSIWTPKPFVTSSGGLVSTMIPPVQTTQKIKISKTTIKSSQGSSPTIVIGPVPGPKPLCLRITLPFFGRITVGFCPPKIQPFPPTVSIPRVTIIPIPPGGRPGPVTPGNIPSEEHKQEEDEKDEDSERESVCPYPGMPDDSWFTEFDDFPFDPNDDPEPLGPEQPGPTRPAAGTGKPVVVFITVTLPPPPTVVVTSIVFVTGPASAPTAPVPEPAPNPSPPQPDSNTEVSSCFSEGRQVFGDTLERSIRQFCQWAGGQRISDNKALQVKGAGDLLSEVVTSVIGKNDCDFNIDGGECRRILKKVVGCRPRGSLLRIGGTIESNCAIWTLDPVASINSQICFPLPLDQCRLDGF